MSLELQLQGIRPAPSPAGPGNLRAATHGAYSARLVLPEADELEEILYAEVPHLRDGDALAVRDYAIAQVRVWRIAAWLEAEGDFDAKGKPRPVLELLRRWLERAEKARARIGLDPVSRATLQSAQAHTADVMIGWRRDDLAEGRRLVEEARSRGELAEPE